MPKYTTHQLWVSEQDAEWTWNHKHHSSHQHARMHNSQTMGARAGCRIDIKSSTPFQSPKCQNTQLTNYECQGRMQNRHKTINTIPVTNMPEYTTHQPMSARAGCRMDMKSWAPFQPPTCQNAQLSLYEYQRRMKNRHETMSTLSLWLHISPWHVKINMKACSVSP